MELSEYISILRKNWLLIIATTLLGLGGGAGLSLLATPEYESNTQLYVSVRPTDGNTMELVQGASYSQNIINSYVAVVETGIVLDPVVDELQLDMTGAQLASYVSVTSPTDSALINVTATSPSADQAAAIAGAVGESLKDVVDTGLETETQSGENPIVLTTTQEPRVPEAPVSPNVPVNLVLGVLAGLALGYGVAVLRSLLDSRIRSINDIEVIAGKPLLGRITHDQEAKKNPLVASSSPRSPYAESLRALRTNLQFVNVNSTGRVYAVTSPGPGEGKTSTALNLAFTLAQTGARVAVVEGDLRRPVFSDYLGIEGGAGLTDVLIGRAEVDDVLQRWGKDQVFVLPAGRIPPNPSELLGSAEMKKTLDTLEKKFDYVIVDAPPVLAVTDAAVLGKHVAGLLMVVATDSTTKQELTAALGDLDTAGAEVLGMIATMVPANASGGHSYGYGRYGGDPEVESPVKPSPTEKKKATKASKTPDTPETGSDAARSLEKAG